MLYVMSLSYGRFHFRDTFGPRKRELKVPEGRKCFDIRKVSYYFPSYQLLYNIEHCSYIIFYSRLNYYTTM